MNSLTTADKDRIAFEIARSHYLVDPELQTVVRLIGSEEDLDPEPIKLLEVDPHTSAEGVVPVFVGARNEHGKPMVPIVTVSVTPSEYDEIVNGSLKLPKDWQLHEEIKRSATVAAPWHSGGRSNTT